MKKTLLPSRMMTTGIILFFIQLIFSGWVLGQTGSKPPAAYPFSDAPATVQAHATLQNPVFANYNGDALTGTTILNGGNRLVATQNPDGGWGWELTGPSAPNTVGPIGKGLIQSYNYTFSATQLSAVSKSKEFLLAKTNTFSASDGYLAKALDEVFGGTTCRDYVNTNFFEKLATGNYFSLKYGVLTQYNTTSYVNAIRTGRAGDQANMAAWDLGLGIVGAASCGVSGSELNIWIAGTKDEINELDANNYYDVIGLAGALYGLAFVGEEFDPTAGAHAAASSLQDLAVILASYQINMGGFTWNSGYMAADEYNETIQETGYAILALSEVNRSIYITNILGAADYIASVQKPSGGWSNDEFYNVGENNEITGEALWGYTTAYSTVNNVTKGTWHMTIQAAIDGATSNDVINVYPGDYNEFAVNRYTVSAQGTAGPYQFGLYFSPSKPGISIIGVDANGNPITDYSGVLATLKTNATNSFGASGIFVNADNITIQGLKILDNYNSNGVVYNNKTVEILGENFTMKFCYVDIPEGGSIYFNDWSFAANTSTQTKYTVTGNNFAKGCSVDICNGTGYTGLVSDRLITNNVFSGVGCIYSLDWGAISFNGICPGVGWFNEPVGGATISGNTFADYSKFIIRTRGTVANDQFNWQNYWTNNTFEKAVITLSDAGTFTPRSYAYGIFTDVRRIGGAIQQEINDVANSGDVVKVAAGNYPEALTVNKADLTIQGAGATSTFITTTTTTPGIIVSSNGAIIKNLGITNPTELIEGIQVSTAVTGLTVDHVNFTNIGNGTSTWDAGQWAHGIHIKGLLTNLNITNCAFNALSATHTANGVFSDANCTLNNFTLESCTFNLCWNGLFLQSNINGFHAKNNTFGPQELSDMGACVAGIYIGDGTAPLILDQILIENNLFTSYGRGVYFCDYNTGSLIGAVEIKNNAFTNSIYSSGIRLMAYNEGAGSATLVGPITIDNNTFTQSSPIVNGSGVAMIDLRVGAESATSYSVDITNNHITFTGPFTLSHHGMSFRGPIGNMNITGNTMNGNGAGGASSIPATSGIVLQSNHPDFGPMSSSANINILNNDIQGFVNGVSVYDFVNNTYGGIPAGAIININNNSISSNTKAISSGIGEFINATCNWFGTAVASGVAAKICGNVNFLPFSTSANPINCLGAGPVTVSSPVSSFMTIQEGVNAANSGATITVAAGTYVESGQIIINKNLSIVGADKATTIIKPAQSTGNSGDTRGWFLVNTGVTFNLSKVSLDGTGKLIWDAIMHHGLGTIDDCIFTQIKFNESGPDYRGAGIRINAGTVSVTNCAFSQMGRNGVIYINGGSGTASGNTYTGKGAGNWLDYAFDAEYGAVMTINNNVISNNLGVTSSDGSGSAGVTVWDDPGVGATFTNNTFTNNSIGLAVAMYGGTTPTVVIGAGNLFNGGETGVEFQCLGAFGTPNITFGSSTFKGQTNAAIALQNGISAGSVFDISSCVFKTTGDVLITDNFAKEDLVIHAIDAGNRGLFVWNAGNVYVTPNSFATPTTTSSSIQRGIDASTTGWTVNVAPGTYQEQVTVIGKTINLIGADKFTTTIQAPVTYGVVPGTGRQPVVYSYNGNLNVSNFTIDGLQNVPTSGSFQRVAGVYFLNSDGVLDNCIIKGFRHATRTNDWNVYGVRVTNTSIDGVTGQPNRTVTISNNTIFDFEANGIFANADEGAAYNAGITCNLTVNAINNTITGGGAIPTAQNGIQLGGFGYEPNSSISGLIKSNIIKDLWYTGAIYGSSGIVSPQRGIGLNYEENILTNTQVGIAAVVSTDELINITKNVMSLDWTSVPGGGTGCAIQAVGPNFQIEQNAVTYDEAGIYRSIAAAASSSNRVFNNTFRAYTGWTRTPALSTFGIYSDASVAIYGSENYWNSCPTTFGDVTYFPYFTTVSGNPGLFNFGGIISNITASATVNPVCSGTSTTIFGNGGSDYLWDHSLGIGSSKVVNPVVNTTYSVTSKDANGCAGAFASIAVNVTAPPAVTITGESVIVLGSQANLTASTCNSYLWSNGLTTKKITVSPSQTTTYTVTGTTNGCSATASHTVTVASVTAGPNQNICNGTSATLKATVTGVTNPTYLWIPGSFTSQTIIVSPDATQTYTVTINGIPALSSNITVFVNKKPIANAGPDIIIAGGITGIPGVLKGNATFGTPPYSWSWTGPGILGSPYTRNIMVDLAGTYWLTVTDAYGCVSIANDAIVTYPVAGGKTVSGNISYVGPVNPQMHNVTVTLTGIEGTTGSFTGVTPATGLGNYQILGVAAGTYKATFSLTTAWGGVTSADIIAIQNHYKPVNPTPLVGIRRIAADVYAPSTLVNVDVNDRNLINAKRINPSVQFTETGNWVFSKADSVNKSSIPFGYANSYGFSNLKITVGSSDVVQDFKSLCYGDVDASYSGMKEIEEAIVNTNTGNGLELSNYPNPFKDLTTIEFTMPVEGSAVVNVFNLLGGKVTTLTDPDNYEGVHTLYFKAGSLAPGIYIYSVTVKTSDDIIIQTGKMIIRK